MRNLLCLVCVATGAIYTTTPPRAAKREAVEKAAESARDGAAEMINGKEKSPFYGINVYGSAPTFADLPGDAQSRPADLPVGTRRRRRPLEDDGVAAQLYIRHLLVALSYSSTNDAADERRCPLLYGGRAWSQRRPSPPPIAAATGHDDVLQSLPGE